MKDHIERLKIFISQHIEINDEEWNKLLSSINICTFSKGEVLQYEGDRKSDVYIVLDGLLRTFFTRGDGEEKTFYFSSEGDLAADYESILKRFPSRYSIDTLETSTVAIISSRILEQLPDMLIQGERLLKVIIEKYFFIWSERITDFYMHSPYERYINLCNRHPDIIQRVPQYFIASYLNISTVHLSRLKRQL